MEDAGLRLRPAAADAIWHRVQHSIRRIYATVCGRFGPSHRIKGMRVSSQHFRIDHFCWLCDISLPSFYFLFENLFLFFFGNDSTISAFVDKVRYFIEAFFIFYNALFGSPLVPLAFHLPKFGQKHSEEKTKSKFKSKKIEIMTWKWLTKK